MDSPFSCLPKWLSLKAGEHLHSLATGGEAEPSPPWQICPDAPSLSRHPHCHGMEPASPDRLSFHASAFASAPISQNFPQNRFPRRAGGRHLVHAGGNYHITEAHQWDGAVLRPGGMARGGWHAGSCITVYVSLEGMPRESKKLEKFCARDGLIRIGSEPSEDGKPIPNPGCLIYA